VDDKNYIKLPFKYAHEFYLRKDYTANWHQEIKETYTYWSPSKAESVLKTFGYCNVVVTPEINEYILEKRLKNKIQLYKETDAGFIKIEFPPTHMTVVGEKPISNGGDSVTSGQEITLRNKFDEFPDYSKSLSEIKYDQDNGIVRIGELAFHVIGKPIIGTKKVVFLLDDGRVLKVVRDDTINTINALTSFFQIIERASILTDYGVPSLDICDYDRIGPPYRYLIQNSLSENSISAVDLIREGNLSEDDIRQIAEIVNKFEKNKQWQIDTNPFSWFKVTRSDGSTQMVYVSSKVYRYNDDWEFRKIGLLQWLDQKYVNSGANSCAAIPHKNDYQDLVARWANDDVDIRSWKRYLDIAVQPSLFDVQNIQKSDT
jgi:hypothetical protein